MDALPLIVASPDETERVAIIIEPRIDPDLPGLIKVIFDNVIRAHPYVRRSRLHDELTCTGRHVHDTFFTIYVRLLRALLSSSYVVSLYSIQNLRRLTA